MASSDLTSKLKGTLTELASDHLLHFITCCFVFKEIIARQHPCEGLGASSLNET